MKSKKIITPLLVLGMFVPQSLSPIIVAATAQEENTETRESSENTSEENQAVTTPENQFLVIDENKEESSSSKEENINKTQKVAEQQMSNEQTSSLKEIGLSEDSTPIQSIKSSNSRTPGVSPSVAITFQTSSIRPILIGDTFTITLEANPSLNLVNTTYVQIVENNPDLTDIFTVEKSETTLTLTAVKEVTRDVVFTKHIYINRSNPEKGVFGNSQFTATYGRGEAKLLQLSESWYYANFTTGPVDTEKPYGWIDNFSPSSEVGHSYTRLSATASGAKGVYNKEKTDALPVRVKSSYGVLGNESAYNIKATDYSFIMSQPGLLVQSNEIKRIGIILFDTTTQKTSTINIVNGVSTDGKIIIDYLDSSTFKVRINTSLLDNPDQTIVYGTDLSIFGRITNMNLNSYERTFQVYVKDELLTSRAGLFSDTATLVTNLSVDGNPPIIEIPENIIEKYSSDILTKEDILSGVTANDHEDGDITKNVTYSLEDGFNLGEANKPGTYYVTYSVIDSANNPTFNKRAYIIKEDQSSLKVLDSKLYVGDSWETVDNFVQAIDKDGQIVDFSQVTTEGAVDMNTSGKYEVTYQYGHNKAIATIEVLENQESLTVKDSTVYTSDSWKPADNFVSATDKNGQSISLSQVTVTGNVDVKTSGKYLVTYSYRGISKQAEVTVLANQTSLTVKNSIIYENEEWSAEDNFTNGTDRDGHVLDFSQITTSGRVDTSKVGKYEVTYSYGGQKKIAIIEVVANQSTLVVKDTNIYVGETWNAKDNFISATEKNGDPIPYEQLEISGEVDTNKPGVYEVSYTYGLMTEKATITVLENQTSLQVKNSIIYTSDIWDAKDNFISATDKAGRPVPLSEIIIKGEVNVKVTGTYSVTYEYGGIKEIAEVTVLQDQTSINIKNSTVYEKENWLSEDNFISATDRDGNNLDFSEITVTGSVNTQTIGKYQVIYSYGNQKSTAVIDVIADQSTLIVKDSSIYLGDFWTTQDNFISATEKNGEGIELDQLEIKGEVDTTKPGQYEVIYSYGELTRTAKIAVLDSLEELIVKDSTIYLGDKWTAKDNFVSAKAKDGQGVAFEQIQVTETVDTTKTGVYKVSYSVNPTTRMTKTNLAEDSSNFVKSMVSIATITVAEREEPIKNIEDNSTGGQSNQSLIQTTNKQSSIQPTTSAGKNLPKTGEKVTLFNNLIGLTIVAVTGLFFWRKKVFNKK